MTTIAAPQRNIAKQNSAIIIEPVKPIAQPQWLFEWAVLATILAWFIAHKGIVYIHPANRLNEIVEQMKTLQVLLVSCQRAVRLVILEIAITPRYIVCSHNSSPKCVSGTTSK